MTDKKKNMIIMLDAELHKELKMYVLMKNQTLQSYILGLIKADMANWK